MTKYTNPSEIEEAEWARDLESDLLNNNYNNVIKATGLTSDQQNHAITKKDAIKARISNKEEQKQIIGKTPKELIKILLKKLKRDGELTGVAIGKCIVGIVGISALATGEAILSSGQMLKFITFGLANSYRPEENEIRKIDSSTELNNSKANNDLDKIKELEKIMAQEVKNFSNSVFYNLDNHSKELGFYKVSPGIATDKDDNVNLFQRIGLRYCDKAIKIINIALEEKWLPDADEDSIRKRINTSSTKSNSRGFF